MTGEDLKKATERVLENIFFKAQKFRNNIIAKFEGQKIFYIKTCEALLSLVQASGYSYWCLNRFQGPEIKGYLESIDKSKMNNKEYNAFLKVLKKTEEIQNGMLATVDSTREALEHILGMYSMCCLNETEARNFVSESCPNLETFLESIGITDVKFKNELMPENKVKYIMNFISHLVESTPEIKAEDWEEPFANKLFEVVNEYMEAEKKELEKTGLARKNIASNLDELQNKKTNNK